MFAMKIVGEDGREHHFRFEEVDPLGFTTFRDCLRNGRQSHPTSMTGYFCDESMTPFGERRTLSALIKFNERMPFYGLVRGGVLPPMYLRRTTFVLDRNVLAAFKRSSNPQRPEASGELFAFDFLDSPTTRINPIMGAFEGAHHRTPSLDEFRNEIREAAGIIRERLPSVAITAFCDATLRQLHGWRLSFDTRAASEAKFLKAVSHLLSARVAKSRLEECRHQIFRAAKECGLKKGLVFITALAKLYESPDGEDGAAAARVLKLTVPYSDADAYNCLSDLRQLELVAASRALGGSYALLTSDQRLALLWCALGIKSVQVKERNTRISLECVPELFPRLPPQQRTALFAAD